MHSGNATILEVEKSASEEEQNSRDEIRQLKEGLSMALEEHAVLHFHNEVLQQMVSKGCKIISCLRLQLFVDATSNNKVATSLTIPFNFVQLAEQLNDIETLKQQHSQEVSGSETQDLNSVS